MKNFHDTLFLAFFFEISIKTITFAENFSIVQKAK